MNTIWITLGMSFLAAGSVFAAETNAPAPKVFVLPARKNITRKPAALDFAAEMKHRVYAVINGKRTQPANVNVGADAGQWHELSIKQVGDGMVVIEAEHYTQRWRDQIRRWYLNSAQHSPTAKPDGDPVNVDGAGGGAYMEALPDTFVTDDDRAIDGINPGLHPGSAAKATCVGAKLGRDARRVT